MSTQPAASTPYLLFGVSQRTTLQEALAARVGRWRAQWSTATAPVSIGVPETFASAWALVTHSSGSLLSVVVDGVALLHVQSPPGFVPMLVGMHTRADEPFATDHEIATQVRGVAMRSLCAALLQGVATERLEYDEDGGTHAARIDTARKQRAFPVAVSFGPHNAKCTLILHPRLVESLAPKRRVAAPGALDRRRLAIADEAVRVQAFLGDVELSLAELTSLSEGDVIVLDHVLSEPAQLLTDAGTHVCTVALGSNGNRRAVRVSK